MEVTMNHIQSINKIIGYEDDYSFPIKTIPMQGVLNDMGIISEIDCNERVMLIRTDTNQYLGNHSSAYRPVTHSQIVDPVRNILHDISDEYVPQIKTYDNGAMMVAKFTCRDIRIKDPSKDDYIAFQVTLRNSYNGMWSIMITAAGLRLWCLNGCTTADKIANFRLKHNGVFKYNFDHLKHSVDFFHTNEERYMEWANTKVSEWEVEKMFEKLTFTARPTIDGKYRNETQFNNLMQQWKVYRQDMGANKWSLYNAVTFWITHPDHSSNTYTKVSAPHKTVVERESKLISYMNKSDSLFKEVA